MVTLNGIRDYGDRIIYELKIVPAQPSNQLNGIPPSLDQAIANLKNAAQETVKKASSGVKIGILGEFGSGKTYLLSSLVDYANFLPISENPTTGNVTALHLKQQEDLQTTNIADWKVEYLNQKGIADCLNMRINLDKQALQLFCAT